MILFERRSKGFFPSAHKSGVEMSEMVGVGPGLVLEHKAHYSLRFRRVELGSGLMGVPQQVHRDGRRQRVAQIGTSLAQEQESMVSGKQTLTHTLRRRIVDAHLVVCIVSFFKKNREEI